MFVSSTGRRSKGRNFMGIDSFPEEYVQNGSEYPDKLFYIVRRHAWNEGVCSVLNHFIAQMTYAEEAKSHGKEELIPIVDMLHYPSKFWRGSDHTHVSQNDWEMYFEQPIFGFGLEDTAEAKHVILGSDDVQTLDISRLLNCYWSWDEIKRYHSTWEKYIHFNKKVAENINTWEKEIFQEDRRIIGCFARMQIAAGKILQQNMSKEEDEAITRKLDCEGWSMSSYTSRQISMEQLADMLKSLLKKWDATHVFLCIDDQETVEYVKKVLGDQVLTIPRRRFNLFKEGRVQQERFEQEIFEKTDSYTLGAMNLAYLTEVYLLSKCSSFVCGRGTGAISALIMNGGRYEHTYLFTPPHEVIDKNWCGGVFEKYKKVYVYGTGWWGQYVLRQYIQNCELPLTGFVVSDGRRSTRYINEYPVYELSELELDGETGLIIAVEDADEIRESLEQRGFQSYILLNKS